VGINRGALKGCFGVVEKESDVGCSIEVLMSGGRVIGIPFEAEGIRIPIVRNIYSLGCQDRLVRVLSGLCLFDLTVRSSQGS
jgi:hypothetical protein